MARYVVRGNAIAACAVCVSVGFIGHKASISRGHPPVLRQSLQQCRTFPEQMLAGLKRALVKHQGAVAQPPEAEATSARNFSDAAPSWEVLAQQLRERQQALGILDPDLENGATNALALSRKFGKAEKPRVKLYRDHAGWCPYCQKVWLQLEEKAIPYTLEKINMRCYGPKPPSYTAKVPSGLLPAIELDGRLITESAEIARVLEEEFPETPLLPPEGTAERDRAVDLMRLERRLFGDWLQWLCNSWNAPQSRRRFEATMDAVDAEMAAAGGPFFLGPRLSLVDIVFTPFLERIAGAIAYYKGVAVRNGGRWKHLDRWFEAMEARPTYLGTRSDYFQNALDLPPQLGGCVSESGAEEFAAAIDGSDGRSWRLPLEPLGPSSYPEPYFPGEDVEVSKWLAASKVVGNHEAIVRFAARGCGEPGRKPVSAPLSDPTAVPGEEFLPDVDAGLRHVVAALLDGAESAEMRAGDGHPFDGGAVVASAMYLRDRVGVPRDLSYPAARQLRAHLNWLIDALES